MVSLYEDLEPATQYIDRQFGYSKDEYFDKLRHSTTVYVGNLSYFIKEEQVYELFSKAGEISRVIMGLDRYKKTPCGFCFVEYKNTEGARVAVDCLSGTKLEERVIRVDWDIGFKEGRQYGRGKGGGQKRDSMRTEFDKERGGYGHDDRDEDEEPRKRRRNT